MNSWNLGQLHGGAGFRRRGGLHQVTVARRSRRRQLSFSRGRRPRRRPSQISRRRRDGRSSFGAELRVGNVERARLAGKKLELRASCRRPARLALVRAAISVCELRVAGWSGRRRDGQTGRALRRCVDAAEHVLRSRPVAAELRIELGRFVGSTRGGVEVVPRKQSVGLLDQELRVGDSPVRAAVERREARAVS